MELFHFAYGCLERVNVQTTTEATVGRHNDETDPLDLTLMHVGVTIFRVGSCQMLNHTTNAAGVGTGRLHAVLRLTHFRRSNHFHGAGDFACAADTRNLRLDLFSDCHSSAY